MEHRWFRNWLFRPLGFRALVDRAFADAFASPADPKPDRSDEAARHRSRRREAGRERASPAWATRRPGDSLA